MGQTKPFEISKRKLWDAYKLVRKNGGAAGVDGMTLESMKERGNKTAGDTDRP